MYLPRGVIWGELVSLLLHALLAFGLWAWVVWEEERSTLRNFFSDAVSDATVVIELETMPTEVAEVPAHILEQRTWLLTAHQYAALHDGLKAREKAVRLAAEKKAAEEAARLAAEKKAAEEAARLAAEKKAVEEAARLAAEKKAAEEAARLAAEKKAAEEAAQLAAEKKAAEEAARLAAEKKAAEEAARLAAEKKAAEEAAQLAAEKKAAEAAVQLAAKKEAEEAAERWQEARRQELLAQAQQTLGSLQVQQQVFQLQAQAEQDAQNLADVALSRQEALYIEQIRQRILSFLVVPPGLRGDLEAKFEIIQLPSGKIIDLELLSPSGNTLFDYAAERAIRKASPLPPPPAMDLFQREIHMNFRPN